MNNNDYFYITLIIILLALLFGIILPYVYHIYNGNIDENGCVADVNTIKCYDVPVASCDYNCTFMNTTVGRVTIYKP